MMGGVRTPSIALMSEVKGHRARVKVGAKCINNLLVSLFQSSTSIWGIIFEARRPCRT